MSTVIKEQYTLDIQFGIGANPDQSTTVWKFDNPLGGVSTVTEIRLAFGFDANGDPSTGTGLFGSLYQDGARFFTRDGEEIKQINGAQKTRIVTTKEDLPI